MKEYEELARMRVDDAIQTGLRSQSIHRALSEDRPIILLTSLKKARQLIPQISDRLNWFALLFGSARNSPSKVASKVN